MDVPTKPLMPQVFISHSTNDEPVAVAIRDGFEAAGIPCWMAPRDIKPGSDWTQGIMRGLKICPIFLLVFSRAANQSKHVRREVGAAFDLGHEVIPIKIEDVKPTEELGYYVNSVQWFNAVHAPLESHLPALIQRVKNLLQVEVAAQPESVGTAPIGSVLAAGKSRKTNQRRVLPLAVGLVFLVAVAAWLLLKSSAPIAADRSEPDAKSIAVLPFANLSADQDSAYFADGVQEDILNNLAKIAQLRVTSRTSVMQFRDQAKTSLQKVVEILGVANVLEGTVRRAGNRIRVTAELVDAQHDRTLWADSFDRDLTDVFAIQEEVAQTVAHRLQAHLTREEKLEIQNRPTDNLEAYDLYLQGKLLIYEGFNSQNSGSAVRQIHAGIAKLEQAVVLDSRFALAHCELTQAYDELYLAYDPSLDNRAAADRAVAEARLLTPDSAEVSLAYARHLYYCYRDYNGLRPELEKARRGLPNNIDVFSLEAHVAGRQGRFAESIEYSKRALQLDPTSLELVQQFAFMQEGLRHWSEAQRLFDRAAEIAPNDPQQVDQRAWFLFNKIGDRTAVEAFLDGLAPSSEAYRNFLTDRVQLAIFDRDWARARTLIHEMGDSETTGWGCVFVNVPAKAFLLEIARLEGGAESMEPYRGLRAQFNQRVVAAGNPPKLLAVLALFDVWLGDNVTACGEAERAAQSLPVDQDPVDGPMLQVNLALVYAWAGKVERALDILSRTADLPFIQSFSYGDSLVNPFWDPLRKDPRYREIMAKLKPKE
jgi:TolB-like protein